MTPSFSALVVEDLPGHFELLLQHAYACSELRVARDNGIELPPDAGLKNARAVAAARWIEREVEERERLARALAQRSGLCALRALCVL